MPQSTYKYLDQIDPADDSTTRIISASIYLFAKDGYKSTSTKSIANYAGVSEALIYKLFNNKHNLLSEVFNEILMTRLPNLLNSFVEDYTVELNQVTSLDNIKQIIFNKTSVINLNWGYIKIIFFELSELDEKTYIKIRTLINSVIGKACHFIDILKHDGYIRKEIDSRLLFRSFIGMINFMIIDINFLTDNRNFEEEFGQIFDLFLKGATHE